MASGAAQSLLRAAEGLLQSARYAEAWPECEALLDAAHGWWPALAVAGRVQLEWGKQDQNDSRLWRAASMLEEAIRGQREDGGAISDRAELTNDRGVALYELGELEKAAEAFEATLEMQPGHERALCNLGLVRWAEGHERIALDRFDEAIASAGGRNPHSLNNRGALRVEFVGGADGAAAALPDFHAALRLDPMYETARRNRDGALATLAEPVPLAPVAESPT